MSGNNNSFNLEHLPKLAGAIEIMEELTKVLPKGAEAYSTVAQASGAPKLIATASNQEEAVASVVEVLKSWTEKAQNLHTHYKNIEEALA